jgi:hypothetical protein
MGIAAAQPSNAHAQRVTGHILDLVTSRPIMGVTVQVVDVQTNKLLMAVTSDTGGHFNIVVAREGVYRLRYLRFGYLPTNSIPVVIRPGEESKIIAAITPNPVMLTAMTSDASAAMAGSYFETRLSSGVGRILNRAEIEARHYPDIASMVFELPGGSARMDAVTHKWAVTLRPGASNTPCPPALYMNGSRLNGVAGEHMDEALDLMLSTSIAAVWAVELYGSIGTIPGIYQGAELTCGVLAVWTQRPG